MAINDPPELMVPDRARHLLQALQTDLTFVGTPNVTLSTEVTLPAMHGQLPPGQSIRFGLGLVISAGGIRVPIQATVPEIDRVIQALAALRHCALELEKHDSLRRDAL